jgi:Kef-type K+ transport system membrane component KefB
MENIFLFLAGAFLFTFVTGHLLERIRIPWVFAALLLGSVLAVYNPFSSITSGDTFVFLGELGMYFLLFIIGMEVNIGQIKSKGGFIFRSTFVIIFLEAVFGGLFIYYFFDYNWFISALVALSFATVGEAVLVPILDEFKAINTRLGQTLLGIGVIDNTIEIAILILVSMMIGVGGSSDAVLMIGSLAVLVVLAMGLEKLKEKSIKFSFSNMETLFFFVVFIFFLFLGIGNYAEAMPLAAMLAGLSVRNFVPPKRLRFIEKEVKAVSYGFFVPIFFLWVGVTMEISALLAYPLAIILLVLISNGAKILGSYLTAGRELGTKQSVLLGIGLSVRFSTSIVIIKILFNNGLVDAGLYSVIIASSIAFKFIVPVIFSNLLVKWNVSRRGLQKFKTAD